MDVYVLTEVTQYYDGEVICEATVFKSREKAVKKHDEIVEAKVKELDAEIVEACRSDDTFFTILVEGNEATHLVEIIASPIVE